LSGAIISEDAVVAIRDFNVEYLKEIVCVCDYVDINSIPNSQYDVYDLNSGVCLKTCEWQNCGYSSFKVRTNECTQDCDCDGNGFCECSNGMYCLSTSIWLNPITKRSGKKFIVFRNF
jgi:hypothetical protein